MHSIPITRKRRSIRVASEETNRKLSPRIKRGENVSRLTLRRDQKLHRIFHSSFYIRLLFLFILVCEIYRNGEWHEKIFHDRKTFIIFLKRLKSFEYSLLDVFLLLLYELIHLVYTISMINIVQRTPEVVSSCQFIFIWSIH